MTTAQETIDALVLAHPGGIALAEIRQELSANGSKPAAERTLRRHLALMVKAGKLRREGLNRATRYFPGTPDVVNSTAAISESFVASDEGIEIRRDVRRPIHHRALTGYNERFLGDYAPGESWYLDTHTRTHLRRIGQIIAPSQPAGTYARQIFERLLIDLAWSSSRLEGNTYSLLDTQNLLELGQKAAGKDAREAQMILNHKKAIEMLVDGAETVRFNRYTVQNLHAALSENLLDNADDEGRVRSHAVSITGTSFIPLSIPQKLNELLDLLLARAEAITDPFEQAFFVMVHLPYLQPFIDVNKRTSRLAANIPLIKQNLCPLSFIDVPQQDYVEGTLGIYELNRYELLRDLFVWAYERSATRYRIERDSVPQPDPIRLRYRQQINRIVQNIVQHTSQRVYAGTKKDLDHLGVAPPEQDPFIDRVNAALQGLHEGSIARYGLLPSEFERWKSSHS